MRQGDNRTPVRPATRRTALLGLLLLAGCSTRVATYTPPPTAAQADLSRPTRVLVIPFVINADAIEEDQGLGPRLQRRLSGDAGQRRAALAADIQSAINDALLKDLAKTGLPTQLAPSDPASRPGDLIVAGAVSRVNEGNRTRRLAVGFGAGKSTVSAVAELYATGADGSRILLQRYDGSADSGHRPGLAAGGVAALGQASALAGAVSVASNAGNEVRRAPVAAQAEHTAHKIAEEIGRFLAQRGWTPRAALTSR